MKGPNLNLQAVFVWAERLDSRGDLPVIEHELDFVLRGHTGTTPPEGARRERREESGKMVRVWRSDPKACSLLALHA